MQGHLHGLCWHVEQANCIFYLYLIVQQSEQPVLQNLQCVPSHETSRLFFENSACCQDLQQLQDRTLPQQKTSRLKPGSSGGWGERSVAEVSMIKRLKRTPWMPLSSGTSSNSVNGLLAAGCRSRFLGENTSRGLRNCLWICRLKRWK